MKLSRRSKDALKTAMAMTIAYGIALSMDWEKPMWAGFAVAAVSLSTVGQSIQQGALRMLGTLLAVIVALILIALFPQERWWFMVAMSLYLGFCTYMMSGDKYQYLWFCAGFVTAVICLTAGPNSIKGFEIAVLRAEETGLGILVYSLISVLIWPTGTITDFNSAASELASTLHRLYQDCLALTRDGSRDEQTQILRTQAIRAKGRFDRLLDASVVDSFEVWEVRRHWRRFQARSAELLDTLERWSGSINDVQDLDLSTLLPNLDNLTTELDRRFDQIESMLAGEAPEALPQANDLSPDRGAVHRLSHFQQAVFTVTLKQIERIDTLTRDLFETIQDVKGFGSSHSKSAEFSATRPGFTLDLDRLAAVVRVVAGMWLAYLLWIYTEVPGGTVFVVMMAPFGMILATKPQGSVSLLFVPVAASIAFSSVLYIFVMPQISSFIWLGTIIFVVTFAVCYLFSAPRQAVARAFGLAMFVVITGISNTQSYSFLSVANTSLMFALILPLLAVVAYIPVSPRPEKSFLRLLRRFFRSAEFLISQKALELGRTSIFLQRRRTAFHLHEMKTLPSKLEAWGAAIDHKEFPGAKAEQVQALVTSLRTLAHRFSDDFEMNDADQQELLAGKLSDDIRNWRIAIATTFKKWSDELEVEPGEVLRERLAARIGVLEDRIVRAIEQGDVEGFSGRDSENFYQLLGDLRDVSQAAVAYATISFTIDWAEWREEVF